MTDELKQHLDGLYDVIFSRRDVRSQFLPDAIPDEVLSHILYAAHHAPSVGYMQPWNFLVIKSDEVKQRIHRAFVEANDEAKASAVSCIPRYSCRAFSNRR